MVGAALHHCVAGLEVDFCCVEHQRDFSFEHETEIERPGFLHEWVRCLRRIARSMRRAHRAEECLDLPRADPAQNVSSGGKVTTRHTEPPGGGSIVCGRNTVSRYSPITGGEESVTQMRAEENPGRAGSVRTSGDGPSIIETDFPSLSSMVTTRRTDFISSLIFNPGFSVDFRTSRPS